MAMTEVMDEDKTRKITEAVEYLSTDDDEYKVNVYILNHGRKNVMQAMDLNERAETYFLNNDFQNAAYKYEEAIKYNLNQLL